MDREIDMEFEKMIVGLERRRGQLKETVQRMHEAKEKRLKEEMDGEGGEDDGVYEETERA
jgi:hypothetical protein